MGELFESALDQAFVGQRGLIGGDAGFLDGGGGQGEADLTLSADLHRTRPRLGFSWGRRSCSSRAAQ